MFYEIVDKAGTAIQDGLDLDQALTEAAEAIERDPSASYTIQPHVRAVCEVHWADGSLAVEDVDPLRDEVDMMDDWYEIYAGDGGTR